MLYTLFVVADQVGHMAYMGCRMGLWGAGTAFASFETFLETMKRRGVSFLEMLVRERER
jgi:hypothetical protein